MRNLDVIIEELRIAVQTEFADTATSFSLTITGGGISQRIEHKTPEQLKAQGISTRNLKGEWIKNKTII